MKKLYFENEDANTAHSELYFKDKGGRCEFLGIYCEFGDEVILKLS